VNGKRLAVIGLPPWKRSMLIYKLNETAKGVWGDREKIRLNDDA